MVRALLYLVLIIHSSPNLLSRSPDDAKIKNKMLYASSKDAIRKALNGIQTDVQATAYDEVDKAAGERFPFYFMNSFRAD